MGRLRVVTVSLGLLRSRGSRECSGGVVETRVADGHQVHRVRALVPNGQGCAITQVLRSQGWQGHTPDIQEACFVWLAERGRGQGVEA
jgi:hypothetical protein